MLAQSHVVFLLVVEARKRAKCVATWTWCRVSDNVKKNCFMTDVFSVFGNKKVSFRENDGPWVAFLGCKRDKIVARLA